MADDWDDAAPDIDSVPESSPEETSPAPRADGVPRSFAMLEADYERQGGTLSARDVLRVIDRVGLDALEATELWQQLRENRLVATDAAELDDEATFLLEATGLRVRDLGALGLFREDLRAIPLLTQLEEIDLARRVQLGAEAANTVTSVAQQSLALDRLALEGEVAKRALVRQNLRLVLWAIREYRGIGGVDYLDLVQDGCLGLIAAASRFDPSKGVRFATYAVWWIRQGVLRAMLEEGRLVRLPIRVAERIMRLRKAVRKLTLEKSGGSPSLRELADELEFDPGEVQALLDLDRPLLSIDDEHRTDEDGGYKLQIPQSMFEPADIALAREGQNERIRKMLDEFPEKEKHILEHRFGLGGKSEKTLAEIGELFGLSRERIRQLEVRAIERFRKRWSASEPRADGERNRE